MSVDQREEVLRVLEQSLGDRVKRGPIRGEELSTEEVLASVLPMSAEEVDLLAQVAARHSVPLVALGAGTAPRERRGEAGHCRPLRPHAAHASTRWRGFAG
jgi:hypothetical protein